MIKSINHFSVNVKNKALTLKFYGEFLKLERLQDIEMEDHRLIYFLLPGGIKLEFIEYYFSTGEIVTPFTAKGMFRHLAFEVSDIKQVAKDIEFYGGLIMQPPKWVERLGLIGMLATDPNGCELEFVQLSN
ncbi:putative enzyme related to lactoylglutathione lyase [Ruminiclostridium sufflavum DSM 19573]|uniref:Putative enzyme related to lactoylglutathione lyase n=1 Tax=Ruminiclostridium sufflavum DSM 19573 TaxID=1121337 RepID=A0A318XKH3_9FIRM|nr:VOC family protein [Ruminiclostridium sufflavum]PYG87935.1 putative enzyme related to lactoylglutathione lyase [Ruminiclostridium sufflavum DSM 19573]